MKKIIYTHGGMYHADELLAIATLKFFTNWDIEVERGFYPSEQYDLILDVGRKYDGEKWFDHHHDSSLESTNILILNKFCKEPELRDILVRDLYQQVSDIDRGIKESPSGGFNSLIRAMNGVIPFERALEIVYDLLVGQIKSATMYISTKRRWDELETIGCDMKIQHDKEVLIGWKELAERDGIKGLITNSNRGGWQIISYDSSKWRIPADHKQTFLHNSGFMAVYETLEDLLEIHYKPTK